MKKYVFYLMVILTLTLSAFIEPAQFQAAKPTDTPTKAVEAPKATEPAKTPIPTLNAPKLKVRVANDATFPPFESIDEKTKKAVGFSIDLFDAIAEKANLEVEYVNTPWDPLLSGMAQCQFDAAISSMTITEERKKSFFFSEPYLNAGQIVVVNFKNTTVKSKDDLKGKSVGAQLGTTGDMEIEKLEKSLGVKRKPYDTYDLAFLDVMNNQIDAVIADYPVARDFVKNNADKLKIVGDVFTEEYFGIAVCNKKEDLLKRINAGLKAVQTEGTDKKLVEKWMGDGSK